MSLDFSNAIEDRTQFWTLIGLIFGVIICTVPICLVFACMCEYIFGCADPVVYVPPIEESRNIQIVVPPPKPHFDKDMNYIINRPQIDIEMGMSLSAIA